MKNAIAIVLMLYSFSAAAQSDPQKIVDEFFSLYKSKGSDVALDYIFGTNKWMSTAKDDIEGVKLKLSGTLKMLGNYEGYNVINTKTVGDHLSLQTFMVRYDRQPLRFAILFYKPNDQWKLLNFSYDDNLGDELDEAAKVYRLKENIDD